MATDRFNGVVASKAIKVRCVLGAEANVAALEGEQTIEGISCAVGDRVLLTAQTNPIDNGVWDVVSGSPWTRAADWDGNRDIEKGSTVWAGIDGDVDKLWQVQTAGVIVIGTTPVSITELFNPSSTAATSLQAVTDVGAVTTNSIQLDGGSLLIVESAAQPDASVATIGQLWVRDDAPNTLMYSDDIGGVYEISSIGGALPGGTVVGSILTYADPNWTENITVLVEPEGMLLDYDLPIRWNNEVPAPIELAIFHDRGLIPSSDFGSDPSTDWVDGAEIGGEPELTNTGVLQYGTQKQIQSADVSPDGLHCIVWNTTNDKYWTYDLATAYDFENATSSFTAGLVSGARAGVQFIDNGNQFLEYVGSTDTWQVKPLGLPYTITGDPISATSTVTDEDLGFNAASDDSYGVFTRDGAYFLACGEKSGGINHLRLFSTATPFVLNTMTYLNELNINGTISNSSAIKSLIISEDGKSILILRTVSLMYLVEMTGAFDLSTGSFSGTSISFNTLFGGNTWEEIRISPDANTIYCFNSQVPALIHTAVRDVPTAGQVAYPPIFIVGDPAYETQIDGLTTNVVGTLLVNGVPLKLPPDGVADGDMLYWDQSGTDAYLATSNLSWDEANLELSIGASLSIEDTTTSNLVNINDNVGTAIMTMFPGDGGHIDVNSYNLWINEAQYLYLTNVGSGVRCRINTSADGRLNFSAESPTGVPAANFEYPIELSEYRAAPTGVTTPHANLWAASWTSSIVGEAMTGIKGSASDRSFTISNQYDLLFAYQALYTATNPGVRLMQFDNATLASITEMYVNDSDYADVDQGWYWAMANVGDILLMNQPRTEDCWVHAEITSITDNTGWWTIGLTVLDDGGGTFINVQHLKMTLVRQSLVSGTTIEAGTIENQALRWDVANDQYEPVPGINLTGTGVPQVVVLIDGGHNSLPEAAIRLAGPTFNQGEVWIFGATSTEPDNFGLVWNKVPSGSGEYARFEWDGFGTTGLPLSFGAAGSVAFDDTNNYFYKQALYSLEKAAAWGTSPGYGELWVKNDDPNTLWFTDDANNDHQLSGIGDTVVTWSSGNGGNWESGAFGTWESGSTTSYEAGAILEIQEAGSMADPAAGYGRFWVRDDIPNRPMFTDDAGDDHVIQLGIRESESVTATNIITAAESGKTFYLNTATGFTSTLPAPALGLKYKFIVATAPTTSGGYVIATDSGANILEGTFLDIVGELQAIAAQDTLTFVFDVSLVGDSLEVESDGTSWFCTAFSKADGGITVAVT